MLSAGPETVELELKEDFLDWKTPDKNIGIDSIVSRIPMSHSRPPRPKNGSIPLDKFDSIIFEEIQESERMFVRFSLSKTTFLIPGLGCSQGRLLFIVGGQTGPSKSSMTSQFDVNDR